MYKLLQKLNDVNKLLRSRNIVKIIKININLYVPKKTDKFYYKLVT